LYDRFACMIFLFIPILSRYMGKKIIQAKRFFHLSARLLYNYILCLSRLLLCSDRVKFSMNTGAQEACEGDVQKNKRKENAVGEDGREPNRICR
jgi:hypothetical protein